MLVFGLVFVFFADLVLTIFTNFANLGNLNNLLLAIFANLANLGNLVLAIFTNLANFGVYYHQKDNKIFVQEKKIEFCKKKILVKCCARKSYRSSSGKT